MSKTDKATDQAKGERAPLTDDEAVEQEASTEAEFGGSTNRPDLPEAIARQHEDVDRRAEERNAGNEEGHQKNQEAIEREAAEAHYKTAHPEYHTPTGKEENHNTPVVNKDGSKRWD